MDMQTPPPPDTEELRLTAIADRCQSREHSASDQLEHPGYTMLYPTYKRLTDALAAIRASCRQKTLALKTYRQNRVKGGMTKSVSPSTEQELALARIVDQFNGRLTFEAIDNVIASLELTLSAADNEFLENYIQWRMANPIAT